MNRLLSVFLISALGLFQSCSNDDTNPFNSLITIDNKLFTPTALEVYNGEQGDNFIREFVLRQGNSNDPKLKQITLNISYPKTQGSPSGTYTFDVGVKEHLYCQGSYFDGSSGFISYGIGEGNLIVIDNGNNNYKLYFQNVRVRGFVNLTPMDPSTDFIITGNIQGTFKLRN